MTEKSADWSMMKQSMQDVYEQYPTVRNGTNFSKLACRLKDIEEGRRYIRAIHPEAVDEASFTILFLECDNMAKAGR